MDKKHHISVTGIIIKDGKFLMSEIKPLTLVSGCSFGVLISEHPENPNKPHLLRCGKLKVFLITKRAPHKKAFPNTWTVPGGNLEAEDYIDLPKDTNHHWYNIFEKVLRREVREEGGLEVEKIKYLTSMTFIRPDNAPGLIVSLYADYKSGEVKLDEDSVEYAWVTSEEAKHYELIDGIYEELEMLDRVLKGEKVEEWKKK